MFDSIVCPSSTDWSKGLRNQKVPIQSKGVTQAPTNLNTNGAEKTVTERMLALKVTFFLVKFSSQHSCALQATIIAVRVASALN